MGRDAQDIQRKNKTLKQILMERLIEYVVPLGEERMVLEFEHAWDKRLCDPAKYNSPLILKDIE